MRNKEIEKKYYYLIIFYQLISAFILFLFENFYLAILAAVILGVSEALSSGVMQTFSYEQFLDDKTYREYLEKSNFIQYLAVAVMTIITPAILQLIIT